jgi:hypothetical protein
VNPRNVPVRFSHLKKMALSPAHYLDAIAEDEEQGEDTPSLRFGRLCHALILRGIEAFAVWDGDRRGNAWKSFRDGNADRDIVTLKEFDKARRVADVVWNHHDASLLLQGEHEIKVPWSLMGRACHSTLDVLGARHVTDLKTTRLAAPGWFSRDALRRYYHAQLAWYLDAAQRGSDLPVREAYIVAVETSRPYAVTCFELTPRALEEGRKLCRLWFEQLLACEAAGDWPGYVQTTVPLDVADDVELEFAPEEVANAAGF